MEITSPTFKPPGSRSFKEFDGTTTHVDIELDPAGINPSRDTDTSSAIQISGAFTAASAGTFPLKGEGNMSGGGGGGGGQAVADTHWSAKVAATELDLWVEEVARDADADIGADICVNAQTEYRTAKWKAHVTPSSRTARIMSGEGVALDFSLNGEDGWQQTLADIGDGVVFFVRRRAGIDTEHGAYSVRIERSEDSSLNWQSASHVIFKFVVAKDEPEQQIPAESGWTAHVVRNPISNNSNTASVGYDHAWVKGNDTLGIVQAITSHLLDVEDNNRAYKASLASQYRFYLATVPADAYGGAVRCSGTVQQRLDDGLANGISGDASLDVRDVSLNLPEMTVGLSWAPFGDRGPKISISKTLANDEGAIASCNDAIYVKPPGADSFQADIGTQVDHKTSDIGWTLGSRQKSVAHTPSIGWTNAEFTANDDNTYGVARYEMIVSSMHGGNTTRAAAQCELGNGIILMVSGSTFEILSDD